MIRDAASHLVNDGLIFVSSSATYSDDGPKDAEGNNKCNFGSIIGPDRIASAANQELYLLRLNVAFNVFGAFHCLFLLVMIIYCIASHVLKHKLTSY